MHDGDCEMCRSVYTAIHGLIMHKVVLEATVKVTQEVLTSRYSQILVPFENDGSNMALME